MPIIINNGLLYNAVQMFQLIIRYPLSVIRYHIT